jgi:hypothetical protein
MIEMTERNGALETVRTFMVQYADHASDGYTTIWNTGRLDLSFEALMHQSEFAPLFTDQELDWACRRLGQYQCTLSGRLRFALTY